MSPADLTAQTIEPAVSTWGGGPCWWPRAGSSTCWPPAACEGGARDDRT